MQQTVTPKKPKGGRLAPQRVLATRQGTILASLVAALFAAVVLLVFLDRYRESTVADGGATTALVASELIEKGTSGEVIATEHLFTRERVSEDQLRDGAISDPDALRGKATDTDVLPGQQLTGDMFSTSNDGIASRLSDYQRAITVAVDTSHGMIGNIRPGDKVDVLGAFNASNGNSLNGAVVRPLVHDALVLDTPSGSSDEEDRINEEKPVTLRVTDNQAAALAFTEDHGKVWLVLRPPTRAKQAPLSAIAAQRLLTGVRPLQIRPGGGIDESAGGTP